MDFSVGVMPITPFAAGTLPSATPVAVPMGGAPCPCTITLKSADAGRVIKLSTDDGTEYFIPTVDTTSATMLVIAVRSPVTHVQFTGAALDTWRIQ